jgi:hypothetical protein
MKPPPQWKSKPASQPSQLSQAEPSEIATPVEKAEPVETTEKGWDEWDEESLRMDGSC